jgi:hypothetical protein
MKNSSENLAVMPQPINSASLHSTASQGKMIINKISVLAALPGAVPPAQADKSSRSKALDEPPCFG